MSDFQAIFNLPQHLYVSQTSVLLTHLMEDFMVSKDSSGRSISAELFIQMGSVIGWRDRQQHCGSGVHWDQFTAASLGNIMSPR